MTSRRSRNRGRGKKNLLVAGVVILVGIGSVPVMLNLMGSASGDPEPVPTSTPETSDVPTGIFSSPVEGIASFADPVLGYELEYPEGWTLSGTGNTGEGVVMSVLSPDGLIIVDISRRFPPPKVPEVDDETHLRGYGQAILNMEALVSPAFEATLPDVMLMEDGTLAFVTRYAISGDSLLAGDILVVIRPQGDQAQPFGDEAFVVRSVAPTAAYLARNQEVQTVVRGFALVDRDEGPLGF
jgi:hypothetical protein